MANTFASTSNAFGILKTWFAGPIVTQFNDDIPIYKHMAQGSEKYNGLEIKRPIKVRRNPGIGATSDGGNLPSIGKQTVVQATINAKYNYLRFGITGPMIKASQGDKGSFVSGMSYEMSEGLNDIKNDVNRQSFWSGDGKLATVSANAVASNVITVTGRESTEAGNKFLDIGMVVDVISSAGAVVASGLTIDGLSGTTTATLTLSTAVTVSATDFIVRTGAYNMEIQGVLTTQDGLTSTVYGIDRALYPVYQGNLISNNNQVLNLNFMQQCFNEARRRGGKIDVIWSDYDSERFYNKLLVTDKRYVGRVVGDGTFSSKEGSYLEYAGCKIVPDKDMPTRFAFMDSKSMKKYVLSELEWADEQGKDLIAQTGTDAYEARLRLFANYFNEKPSSSAIATGYLAP